MERAKKAKDPVKRWLIVTVIVVVFALVVNILLSFTFLFDLVSLVFGQKHAIYAESGEESETIETTSKADARDRANALVEEVAGEGIVLLRNAEDALPLPAGSRVSVFGKNSVNLVYSGSGSGSGDNSAAKTIFDSLEAAGIEYNPVLKSFYEDSSKSGKPRGENSNFSQDLAKFDTGETPYESYAANGIPESYADYSDAAIIVISRIGGEEFDLTNAELAARERHYLQLDENEERLVHEVCAAGFQRVILVVNSANVMELGFVESGEYGDIDACLWMGAPGNNGVMALGKILTGEVNPSGHTVDTWIASVAADPTYNNFGDNGVTDGDRYSVDGKTKNYYFVDYEEGIYVGYRFYETADYEARTGNFPGFDYDAAVVYPFGYGLSYTTFAWTLESSDLDGAVIAGDGIYTITIRVKNTGSVPGKDVIELYASAPYTAGGIEKAHKVLCGFAKTELLQPGEEQSLTIEVDLYDLASYDYSDANSNGFAGYELEAGDYTLYIAHDAHTSETELTFRVGGDGIRYEVDPVTGTKVENQFEDADDQLGTLLSRSDFAGTWPETRTADEMNVSSAFIKTLSEADVNNPNDYTEMPLQGAKSGGVILLREMVGLDFDDERWEDFLDQLTVDEMATLYNQGAFKTESIERLGVPKTTCSDGPVGFVAFQGSGTVYGAANYCCEVMMASTWNTELLEEIGASLAEEGHWGNEAGDGMPYSGIYAPAANIHRSPFSGRNWEYFSEDGFLSGVMAAAEIKAANEGGLVMFMKHFALNDQETHRNAHGLCTWANEQSIRELYLKPFEKAVKLGEAHGVMSSFNRIGSVWAGGSYALLTTVLREEWGFRGAVISDYVTGNYCDPLQAVYAGGDLNLTSTIFLDDYSAGNAGDVTMLRRAAKNILYAVAQTNAMEGEIVGYRMPVWQEVMLIVDGVLAAGLALWGWQAIRGARKRREEMGYIRICEGTENENTDE